ncbi:Polyisoprenoid-binding protein YceI [Chryseobacterium ureilyticum]|uniref:Polyisoprenoid-binding protein YceI n=1 Tax=Chryseobacterium ureilyticum TaxID=373668 RepID=A0A1N7M9W4_9FLAO|nr:YceI family protein [Chryseobacterium ureilyticum]SIS82842.1 Polyisoprenoid-binding protein YceI [Chryseobacterium ureilyticum]
MKKLFLSFAFMLLSIFTFAQNNWEIDPMHSSVNFNIKHMGISFVQGRFDKFAGTLTTKESNLDHSTFNVTVATESINTGVEMRDKHLKSDDFFSADKYPDMKFEGASVTKDKNGVYVFKGKLTIKGVTKDVSVPVTLGGLTKNKEGKEMMGLQTKFSVNRFDYDLKYDPTGTAIAKDVSIDVYLELIKK